MVKYKCIIKMWIVFVNDTSQKLILHWDSIQVKYTIHAVIIGNVANEAIQISHW